MGPPDSSILVVDDDRDTCENLADILGELGHRVDTACGGTAALTLARDHAYDVALLDLKMPGMDGLALSRALRQLRPATITLIVTSLVLDSLAAEASSAGVWTVISKPIHVGRLLQQVDEALAQTKRSTDGPAGRGRARHRSRISSCVHAPV